MGAAGRVSWVAGVGCTASESGGSDEEREGGWKRGPRGGRSGRVWSGIRRWVRSVGVELVSSLPPVESSKGEGWCERGKERQVWSWSTRLDFGPKCNKQSTCQQCWALKG